MDKEKIEKVIKALKIVVVASIAVGVVLWFLGYITLESVM